MLKWTLRNAYFYVVTVANIIVGVELIRDRIKKVAAAETVYSPFEYVAVKLARGDYMNVNGIEQIRTDYVFYKQIDPKYKDTKAPNNN
jgi:hypothetical protein